MQWLWGSPPPAVEAALATWREDPDAALPALRRLAMVKENRARLAAEPGLVAALARVALDGAGQRQLDAVATLGGIRFSEPLRFEPGVARRLADLGAELFDAAGTEHAFGCMVAVVFHPSDAAMRWCARHLTDARAFAAWPADETKTVADEAAWILMLHVTGAGSTAAAREAVRPAVVAALERPTASLVLLAAAMPRPGEMPLTDRHLEILCSYNSSARAVYLDVVAGLAASPHHEALLRAAAKDPWFLRRTAEWAAPGERGSEEARRLLAALGGVTS